MFTHILCPTDFGERAHTALKAAARIAHRHGSKITMLNIHPEFMNKKEMEMLRVSAAGLKEKFKDIALTARKEMESQVQMVHADDIPVDYLLREGKPETAIPHVATELGVDLIVICTDGRDNVKDVITGTITERVVNSLCCPVLVVPWRRR